MEIDTHPSTSSSSAPSPYLPSGRTLKSTLGKRLQVASSHLQVLPSSLLLFFIYPLFLQSVQITSLLSNIHGDKGGLSTNFSSPLFLLFLLHPSHHQSIRLLPSWCGSMELYVTTCLIRRLSSGVLHERSV